MWFYRSQNSSSGNMELFLTWFTHGYKGSLTEFSIRVRIEYQAPTDANGRSEVCLIPYKGQFSGQVLFYRCNQMRERLISTPVGFPGFPEWQQYPQGLAKVTVTMKDDWLRWSAWLPARVMCQERSWLLPASTGLGTFHNYRCQVVMNRGHRGRLLPSWTEAWAMYWVDSHTPAALIHCSPCMSTEEIVVPYCLVSQ